MEYRAGNEALSFTTFKTEKVFLYRRLGVRIRARGTPFERAAIDSKYLSPSYAGLCTVEYDSDHDANDDELEESKYGLGPPGAAFPTRVQSLCRAQWKHERFSDIVSLGPACEIISGLDMPFPTDFPVDWPPDTGMAVTPSRLTITSKGGASARGTITVTNRDPGSYSLTIFDAVGPYFQNPAGTFPLPASSQHLIPVQFVGGSPPRAVCGSRSTTDAVSLSQSSGTVDLGGGEPF